MVKDKIEEKKEEAAAASKETERFVIQEVPTQVEPMIIDTKTKVAHTELSALLAILNKLDQIEQGLGVGIVPPKPE